MGYLICLKPLLAILCYWLTPMPKTNKAVKPIMAVIIEITNETDGIVRVKTFHLPDNPLSDDDEGDRLIESVGDHDEAIERAIVAATVRKLLAFAGLTVKEQAILRLTYWDEASDDEIAQALQVSPSRVKLIRQMAIAKLRLLARKWGLL